MFFEVGRFSKDKWSLCSVSGVWDVPTDRTQLNVNLAQWTQMSKNVVEDYIPFDSLKKIQFPKGAKDAIESSKNLMPVVKPSMGAGSWNSGVDYCVEALFGLPSKCVGGFRYVSELASDGALKLWKQINATGDS